MKIFCLIAVIVHVFSYEAISQSKTKVHHFKDANTLGVYYGKLLNSTGFNGHAISLEYGLFKKRKLPLLFELAYSHSTIDTRQEIETQNQRKVITGYKESAASLETKLKLDKKLFALKNLYTSIRPFASLGYNFFKNDPYPQNQYKTQTDFYNLGIGLGLNFGIHLTKHLRTAIYTDFTFIRAGYEITDNGNPLLLDFQRINSSFTVTTDDHLKFQLGLIFALY